MSHLSHESPFFLVIGWNNDEYPASARQSLASLVAHLRDTSGIRGCLATIPAEANARQWVFSLLGSVKRATSASASAMVRASVLSSAHLAASSAASLDEVIIIQDTADPAPAIETVRNYQQSNTTPAVGIRIWLDAPGASLQSLTCAWKYGTLAPLRVELPPFRQISSNGFSAAVPRAGQQLACEWLRSTITVSASGSIVPCPAYFAHDASRGAPAEQTPTDVVAHLAERRSAWMRNGGSHPVCASCNRLVRFTGPGDAEIPAQPCVRIAPAPVFVDHIRMDASGLSLQDRAEAIRAFVDRISATRGIGPA